MSPQGLEAVGRIAYDFALIEGLDAHARSIGIRLNKGKS
jgi:histidinol dehydrogenase